MNYTIATEFSRYPAGRDKSDGKFTGEHFRDDVLIPTLKTLKEGQKLTIILDGTRGYGSSFLEEAFGGLFRLSPLSEYQALAKKIDFKSKDPSLPFEIKTYMAEELTRAKAK